MLRDKAHSRLAQRRDSPREPTHRPPARRASWAMNPREASARDLGDGDLGDGIAEARGRGDISIDGRRPIEA